MLKRSFQISLLTASITLLASCGGDSTPNTLSGTAAVGAEFANATIIISDANDNEVTTTTDENGKYSADISNLTAPLLVRAAGDMGDIPTSIYSLVTDTSDATSKTANITPLTDLVVSLQGGAVSSPESIDLSTVTTAGVTSTTDDVMAAIAPVATALNYSTENIFTESFDADGTGLDAVLDSVAVTRSADGAKIVNKLSAMADDDSLDAITIGSNAQVPSNTTLSSPNEDELRAVRQGRLRALAAKFDACFANAAADRLSDSEVFIDVAENTVPKAGAALPDNCTNFQATDYMHNGQTFMTRWAYFLNHTGLQPSAGYTPKFQIIPIYTRDIPNRGKLLYANIVWNFKNGIGASKFELIKYDLTSDSLQLVGNKRQYNASVAPMLTKNIGNTDDGEPQTKYLGSIKFSVKPNLLNNSYSYADAANGDYTADPSNIGCVWATGEYISGITGHDVNAPKGGVLLKTPHNVIVDDPNYMAIAYQYLPTFDPLNNQDHFKVLWKDCQAAADYDTDLKNIQYDGTAVPANTGYHSDMPFFTTKRTDPAYVIDMEGVTYDGTNAYSDGYHHRSNGQGTQFAATMLDANTRIEAEGKVLPRYTFWVFNRELPKWNNLRNETDTWENFQSDVAGSSSHYVAAHFNSRMVGKLPELSTVTELAFPELSAASIDAYLKSDSTENSNINLSWTNDEFIKAVRVGVLSFNKVPPSNSDGAVNETNCASAWLDGTSRTVEKYRVKKSDQSLEDSLATPLQPITPVTGACSSYRKIFFVAKDFDNRLMEAEYDHTENY